MYFTESRFYLPLMPGSLFHRSYVDLLLRLREKSVIIVNYEATPAEESDCFVEGNDIMKVIKLLVGILCIVLSLFVALQTFILGPGNALFAPLELNRTCAIAVTALFFLGGIIMASTDRSRGVGGEVICILLFFIGTVAGVLFSGSMPEFRLWAGICLALAAINLISLFTK